MTTLLNAYIAANRFGFGPRPRELARIGDDARGWLKAQIQPENSPPAAFSALPETADSVLEMANARRTGTKAYQATVERLSKAHAPAELKARIEVMTTSESPFRERLVQFWSNHFTVSGQEPKVLPLAGAYEREVIRPHVFGRFEKLLLAAIRHPAMLMYLDNQYSFGPNSPLGQVVPGFSERLAQEILMHHTLSPDGPYGQDDVHALAKMLTGWSHGGIGGRGPHDGHFRFRPTGHEPGAKSFLGKHYPESGVEEAERALAFLAGHHATARFISTKLVRHFVADDPPPAAVRAITRVFSDSGGDLAQVAAALVDLDIAWAVPLTKVKTPYELVVSTLRTMGHQGIEPHGLMRSLRELGQQAYRARTPAGWSDQAKDWMVPDALIRRIDWAREIASRAPRTLDPLALADIAIGPVASRATLDTVKQAPSVEVGIALVLASAEFQQR
ncbi:DUF1800 domain-containing protein [Candidatus Entotheonella palauensis]|uniref:DUF1800 domain-containing protein n=1 Tax=Candidatus Entotheonella palauensis TaxID=93172 RepID=UPI0011779811|nr:DUF1800 domain-containing protein [Candidatus Entotheonella palauensis]